MGLSASQFEIICNRLENLENQLQRPEVEEIMTREEVANMLDCSTASLDRAVNRGFFKRYRLPGSRRVYFKRSEVMAAIEVNPVEG